MEKEKYRFDGTLEFLKMFESMLSSRKKVALFDNYTNAKNDIIFEIISHNKDIKSEVFFNIIFHLEQICDIEEYFNKL